MPTFIELTKADGYQIWINPSFVTAIFPDQRADHCWISIQGQNANLLIWTTPEQVLRLLTT